jgi:hypothetical protein
MHTDMCIHKRFKALRYCLEKRMHEMEKRCWDSELMLDLRAALQMYKDLERVWWCLECNDEDMMREIEYIMLVGWPDTACWRYWKSYYKRTTMV